MPTNITPVPHPSDVRAEGPRGVRGETVRRGQRFLFPSGKEVRLYHAIKDGLHYGAKFFATVTRVRVIRVRGSMLTVRCVEAGRSFRAVMEIQHAQHITKAGS